MATRANLVTEIRALCLDETTATHWTDATVALALDRAQRQIAREVRCLHDSFTANAVADQYDYVLPGTWFPPMDYVIWEWGTSGQETRLDYVAMRHWAAWVRGGSGTPSAYTLTSDEAGMVLRLMPAPSANGTANIFVQGPRQPVDLTADGTVCELPADCHDAMVEYAAFLLFRQWEEMGRAMEFKSLYDEILPNLMHRYQMPAGGWPIVDTQFGMGAGRGLTGYTASEMPD